MDCGSLRSRTTRLVLCAPALLYVVAGLAEHLSIRGGEVLPFA